MHVLLQYKKIARNGARIKMHTCYHNVKRSREMMC